MAAHAAIIVVRTWHGKRVGAHADAGGIAGYRGEGEDFWVVVALAGNSTDVAIDIVKSTFIDPGDSFANVDGQIGWAEVQIASKNRVVCTVAVLGEDLTGDKTQ